MIKLGSEGTDFAMILVPGCDFFAPVVGPEPWASGSQVELWLPGPPEPNTLIWIASIDEERATWDIPAAEVQEVIDAQIQKVRMIYRRPNGGPLPLGRGTVSVV